MKLSDFDYDLPRERIAQQPADPRDASRLLVLGGSGTAPEHHRFDELASQLRENDLLVLNDTRVLPARLAARKTTGGRVELLMLQRESADVAGEVWRSLLRASRKPGAGTRLLLDDGTVVTVLGRERETWRLKLATGPGGDVAELLGRLGRMPLPPYIERSPADEEFDRLRYQTVYAEIPGAIAAPTAGLHFTEPLLQRIVERGVRLARITLHVGPGTFLPVRCERIESHSMHAERYVIGAVAREEIDRARERGGRIVAVGTTVVRALEDRAAAQGHVIEGAGESTLFIVPGFRFRVVDAMITNFHLPRSTLLMLVCAFAGRERVLSAYAEALERGYRFYSYGDAMFIEARS